MNNHTGKSWKEIESKGLDEVICNWNLNRIFIIVALTILFELANLLNKQTYYTDTRLFLVLSLLSVCFIFTPFMLYIHFFCKISISFKRKLYLLFWIVYPVLLTPFYAQNIQYDDFPINMAFIFALIATFPIINIKQAFLISAYPFAVNVLLMFVFKPDLTYVTYFIVCIIASIFIAINIHGKYLDLLTELSNSSTYDSLTGILNKNAGYQRAINMLEMCKRSGQPFCVYMMDIDYFKPYNDTYGHQAGDSTLKNVALCITNTFVRKQDIICRYGGEEFLICCTSASKEISDFEMMAGNLLDNIYDLKIEAGNKSVSPYVTACIGYTVFYSDNKSLFADTSLDFLIRQADQALYKAKALGRNQYYRI